MSIHDLHKELREYFEDLEPNDDLDHYYMIEQECKESLANIDFKVLVEHLKTEEPFKDQDNEEWVQELYLGNLRSLIPQTPFLLRTTWDFTREEIYIEELEKLLSDMGLYWTTYDSGEIVIGRFVDESEFYNHPDIMASLHITLDQFLGLKGKIEWLIYPDGTINYLNF